MASNFTIKHRIDKSALHVTPQGDLDGSTAWQIINLIKDLDDGFHPIVIDTRRLGKIFPFGTEILQWNIPTSICDMGRIRFTGPKVRDIAPPGCVIAGGKA